jgi:hypothetical protein
MNMSIGFPPLLSMVISLVLTALVASGFAALADWLARRHGTRMILPLWFVTTVLLDAAFVFNLSRRQSGMDVPDTVLAFPLFWFYFPMWALSLGAVALYIARRHRRGKVGLTTGAAAASTGLFIAGNIAFLVVILLWELAPAFLR